MRLLEKLVAELGEHGVYCDAVNEYADDALPEKRIVSNQTVILDFSEHDKKVAEEKGVEIRELKRLVEVLEEIIADGKKPDISVSENGVSDCCRPSIEWYDNRHQSDCIEINRLNTALEVMTEKYMKLREVHGL